MPLPPDADPLLSFEATNATLLDMGFDKEKIEAAMRMLGNVEMDRLVAAMMGETPGLDEYMANGSKFHCPMLLPQPPPPNPLQACGELVASLDRENYDTTEVDALGFPLRANQKILAQLKEKSLIYKGDENDTLDKCLKLACDIVMNDGESSSLCCAEFISIVVPEAVTCHMNPRELKEVSMPSEAQVSAHGFCLAVIPLLAARMSKTPILACISRCVSEITAIGNKYMNTTRRRSINVHYLQDLENHLISPLVSVELVSAYDTQNRFPYGRYVEIVERYATVAFPMMTNVFINPDLVIEDALHMLLSVENCAKFLNNTGHQFTHIWLSNCIRLIENASSKQIRDMSFRQNVIHLLTECINLAPYTQVYKSYEFGPIRLSFLLKCINCGQLDAKLFVFQELESIIQSFSVIVALRRPVIGELELDQWLKQNGILKIVLDGNMDHEFYVKQAKPVIEWMAHAITESEIDTVWSLRKGRLGVSAENFEQLMTLIGCGLDENQLRWLQSHFMKCFQVGEDKMYARIFSLCLYIGKHAKSEESRKIMVENMYRLIQVAKQKGMNLEYAMLSLVEMIAHLKNCEMRQDYFQRTLQNILSNPMFPITEVLFIQKLLDAGPKHVNASTITSTSTMVTRRTSAHHETAWGDYETERTRFAQMKKILRDSSFFEYLTKHLIANQKSVHTAASNVEFFPDSEDSMDGINDDNSDDDDLDVREIAVSGDCRYGFVMDTTFNMMNWLIVHDVVPPNWNLFNELWTNFVSSEAVTPPEKKAFLSWLNGVKLPDKTLCQALIRFFKILPENLTLEGFNCLYDFYEQIRNHISVETYSCMKKCENYFWVVLESSETRVVVDAISTKLIQAGAQNDTDGSKHRLFLDSCFEHLEPLRLEYFRRKGKTACSRPVIVRQGAATFSPERQCLVVPPMTQYAETSLIASSSTTLYPESIPDENVAIDTDEAPGPSSGTTARNVETADVGASLLAAAQKMSLKNLVMAIDRILQLICKYIEYGDEKFTMLKSYPSHGSLKPGRKLHVRIILDSEKNMEEDMSYKNSIRTQANEPIGLFRSRIANRLHYRNCSVFTLEKDPQTLEPGASKEIPIKHEWHTLAMTGICNNKYNSSKVSLTVKPKHTFENRSSFFRSTTTTLVKKTFPETNLPGNILSRSMGVLDVLFELQTVDETDAKFNVQETCYRLLSLIPTDQRVRNMLTPADVDVEALTAIAAIAERMEQDVDDSSSTSSSSSKPTEANPENAEIAAAKKEELILMHTKVDGEKIKSHLLNINDPYKMIYGLEAMAGILLPCLPTRKTMEHSCRLTAALINAGIHKYLVEVLAESYKMAPMKTVLRQNMFNLILFNIQLLMGHCSLLDKAINDDQLCLRDLSLRHSAVINKRRDNIYEDISELPQNTRIYARKAFESASDAEFTRTVTILRDFTWLVVSAMLNSHKKMYLYEQYCGVTSMRINENGIEVEDNVKPQMIAFTTSCKLIRDQETVSVNEDIDIALEAINLLFKTIRTRIFGTCDDDHDTLRFIFEDEMWVEFWTDIFVNTMYDKIRFQTSIKMNSILDKYPESEQYYEYISPMITTLLFKILDRLPLNEKPTRVLDKLQKKQRVQMAPLICTIHHYLSYYSDEDGETTGVSTEQSLFESIRKDPTTIAHQMVDCILKFEIDPANQRHDRANMENMLKLLINLLGHLSADDRSQIGRILIVYLLGKHIYPKVDNRAVLIGVVPEANRWFGILRDLGIRLIHAMSKSTPDNILRVAKYLYEMNLSEMTGETAMDWDVRMSRIHRPRQCGYVGLQNGGGTCYMNASMQQIMMIPGLAAHILSIKDLDENQQWDGIKTKFLMELQRVLACMMFTHEQSYRPRRFWDEFTFADGEILDPKQQHDAIEFITCVTDKCDTIMQKLGKPEIFKPRIASKFVYEYICYGCWHRYEGSADELNEISLELFGHCLEDCLEHYVDGEMLVGDNAYRCEKCGEKRSTLRRGSFREFPDTMMIQLKRFSFDGRQARKNDSHLAFPNILDMSPYSKAARHVDDEDLPSLFDEKDSDKSGEGGSQCSGIRSHLSSSQPTSGSPQQSPSSPFKTNRRRRRSTMQYQAPQEDLKYELVGVLSHSGVVNAGHYISFIKERREEMVGTENSHLWFEFNDSTVREHDSALSIENWYGGAYFNPGDTTGLKFRAFNAYVLFYQRCKKKNSLNGMDISAMDIDEEKSCALSTTEVFDNMPTWLKDEIIEMNTNYFKARDLHSTEYLSIITDMSNQLQLTIKEIWEDKLEDERDDLVGEYFKIYFSYCVNIYWHLAFNGNEMKKDLEASANLLCQLLEHSQQSRIKYLELVSDNDYKLMNQYCNLQPGVHRDEVIRSWWIIVNRVIRTWAKAQLQTHRRHAARINHYAEIVIEVARRFMGMINCENVQICGIFYARLPVDAMWKCVCWELEKDRADANAASEFVFLAGGLEAMSEVLFENWGMENGQFRVQLVQRDFQNNRLMRQVTLIYLSMIRTMVQMNGKPHLEPQLKLTYALEVMFWLFATQCYQNDTARYYMDEIFYYAVKKSEDQSFFRNVVQVVLKSLTLNREADGLWLWNLGLIERVSARLIEEGDESALQYMLDLLDGREYEGAEHFELNRGILCNIQDWLLNDSDSKKLRDCKVALNALAIIFTESKSEGIRNLYENRRERVDQFLKRIKELEEENVDNFDGNDFYNPSSSNARFLHGGDDAPAILDIADCAPVPRPPTTEEDLRVYEENDI